MSLDQLAVAIDRFVVERERRQNGAAIAASANAPRAGAMTANRRQPLRTPTTQGRTGPRVTAATGCSTITAGMELTSRDQLGQLAAEALEQMVATPGAPRRQLLARARWELPPERRLGTDALANGRLIEAVCSPQAVVASGGVCLPVNVTYGVPTWAGATRPLRDALPAFQADRGGLRFVSPPDLGVPSLQSTPPSGLASATTVWTEATDANPAGATKPVFVVNCGSEQLVYVNAVVSRLQFGNMMGRFAPEQIAANTDVAMAAAAREAELELLVQMFGSSKQIKASEYLGATRDLLASADLLSSQYRYSHRIPRATTLTAVFPAWALDVIRADLAREIGHGTAGGDRLGLTDDQIEAWFAARNIRPIWTLDSVKAGTYGVGGTAIPNQFFPLAGTTAPTATWPGQSSHSAFTLAWLLYAEGSFQFLDGGRLTLGVVRDSTLDATNDYETFVESFEGVAFRGLDCYQVQSTILPTGGSAGTVRGDSVPRVTMPTDPDRLVVDDLALRFDPDERERLQEIEDAVAMRARPVTHIRVDGEQTTVYGSHLSAADEAHYERLYRDALQRHRGLAAG